jgi:hypothetical protein
MNYKKRKCENLMKKEVTGGWRKLHNLYSSPNIIRMIKSRRMSWAGHVARLGRPGMQLGYWWESQKDHYKDQDIGGWIILKWILQLEKEDGVVWTGLIWLRIGTNGGLL